MLAANFGCFVSFWEEFVVCGADDIHCEGFRDFEIRF